MNEMELMMYLHLNNNRQGPGDENATKLALQLAQIDTTQPFRVADIGCGTGAQTVTLAKLLKGEIIAVDIFDTFLQKMKERIYRQNLQTNISMLAASMDDLPFQKEEFDIIWSEGAVYNIGFRKGITYWKNFLKKGGILAVSELSWITNSRPKPLEDFWLNEYPEVSTASEKIKVLEDAGYKVLGHFILPENCWTENYYIPLLKSHDNFIRKFGHISLAHKIVETDRQEMEFYSKYKEYYSYGFYIARKI